MRLSAKIAVPLAALLVAALALSACGSQGVSVATAIAPATIAWVMRR